MKRQIIAMLMGAVSFVPIAAVAQDARADRQAARQARMEARQENGGQLPFDRSAGLTTRTPTPERAEDASIAPAARQERRAERQARQQITPADRAARIERRAARMPVQGRFQGEEPRAQDRPEFRRDRTERAERRGDRPSLADGLVSRRQYSDDRREDRREFRQDRREDARDDRSGRFDQRRDDRVDQRRWYDRSRFANPNSYASQRGWNRDWRRDHRYDWTRYRATNRYAYRLPRYYAPANWNYGYRRFSIGIRLGAPLFSRNYWIVDPWSYRLPEAYGQYRWVRYYDDALLVDLYTGQVVDVVSGIFW